VIDVRQRGESIEITDTPATLATAMAWFARVSLWLGLALGVAGVVATVVAVVRGGNVLRAIEIVPQALVLVAFGWFGGAAWRKLATSRRTVIDRARGTIDLSETSPGGTPYARSEHLADVVDLAIESSEARGPERTALRLVRLWVRMKNDRRLMLGDVGETGGDRRSLDRAAGLVASFLGVTIGRESTSEIAPAIERVATPRAGASGSRSWPMMSLAQRLSYVPGVAVLLCGGTYLVLACVAYFGGDTAKLAGARTFVLAISPLVLALPAIPMLALGGVVHATIEGGRLTVVRSRAWVRGEAVVMEIVGSGAVSLRAHAFGGRMRGVGRLVATQDGRDTVLVAQAPLPGLERVADELGAMLGGTTSRS
jgi:hypothetical protein